MNIPIIKTRFILFCTIILLTMSFMLVQAEVPTVLTDKVRSGDGIIDIFQDVNPEELEQYLESGTMFLGVDLNEDASGLESSTSAGVAIKEIELLITTTEGDFSFTEFYTNTSALIQEAGTTEAEEFYTLFGSAGSSQITGSSGFDISQFDDVINIENINITGEILDAQLNITFLDTAAEGANESFFDYSAGFEEFAILSQTDATLLDSADIGLGEDAPETIDYAYQENINAPSGAPEPYWFLLLAIPALYYLRKLRSEKSSA